MTERRRKTRKKVLKHGDLFHVYIASDTPKEVCEYLSRLKENGDFSYEILQIISDHVKRTQATSKVANESVVGEAESGSTLAKQANRASNVVPPAQEQPAAVHVQSVAKAEVNTSSRVDGETAAAGTSAKPEALDPIQLLRQQRRAWVSGK